MSTVSYRLEDIAQLLEGKLHGDASCQISGIGALLSARPGQIAFFQGSGTVPGTAASAVILSESALPEGLYLNAVVVSHPRLAYAKLAKHFIDSNAKPMAGGVHTTAVIGEGCVLPEDVSIGAHCVLGEGVRLGSGVVIGPGCSLGEGVEIGDNAHLYANVSLYSRVSLGKRVIVHSGAVIGADGFGFEKDAQQWIKVPQLGGVRIGDDVEIGASTTIDCGAIEDTVIESGVKLDNQVQIGHNVHIGAHTVIAGMAGVAGSTRIGAGCVIAGGSRLADHIELPSGTVLAGNAIVPQTLKKAGIYATPYVLLPRAEAFKHWVHLKKLNKLVRGILK